MARRMLASMGLLTPGEMIQPDPAGRDALERFHEPAYLDMLIEAPKGDMGFEGLYMGLGTEECPVFKGMYDYAALACGATLAAADAVANGRARAAFNPSGGFHHAHPAKASGFCYVNDVAIACMRLADDFGRVLFLDVDVHHCDGVQDAFHDRRDVMTVSFHEKAEGFFPGTGGVDETGVGDGEGYSVNVPLPPGTHDAAYLRAFRAIAPPLATAYEPDVIVLEIGMDCLSGDPLAHLSLTNNAYAEVVESVLSLGRPLVVTGGGGYHPDNTARGWALVWTILSGRDTHDAAVHGLGGVMLESTDWQGGLRDRVLAGKADERAVVDEQVDATVEEVRRRVFPVHGL